MTDAVPFPSINLLLLLGTDARHEAPIYIFATAARQHNMKFRTSANVVINEVSRDTRIPLVIPRQDAHDSFLPYLSLSYTQSSLLSIPLNLMLPPLSLWSILLPILPSCLLSFSTQFSLYSPPLVLPNKSALLHCDEKG